MPYILEPEVAGGWGPGTQADTTVHPPVVRHLVHQFDGWLGDDLLETFPCFIVTERLAAAIKDSDLSGAQFEAIGIFESNLFKELHPSLGLPRFYRLKVAGTPDADFTLDVQYRLRVTDAALFLLQRYNLANCNVSAEG